MTNDHVAWFGLGVLAGIVLAMVIPFLVASLLARLDK
jgi:hypothetical protein